MNTIIAFAEKNRKKLLAAAAILTITAVAGIFQIDIETNFDIFRLDDSSYQLTIDRMDQLFGTSNQIIIQTKAETSVINGQLIKQLRKIQEAAEALPAVKQVSGPAPAAVKTGRRSISLDSELSSDDIDTLDSYYGGMGKLSPLILNGNSIYAVFTIFPTEDFSSSTLSDFEDFLVSEDIDYSIAGDLYMQGKILEYIKKILLFVPPAALLLILTVFRFRMGSIKATVLSVMPAGIAAVWTLGLIGWSGKAVSILTVLAPIFTIVIGSADGLHFISHVQDSEADGNDRKNSIISTLRIVGIPIIITTVTSMAGFLSLLVMNTTAVRDLSFYAAVGILLAGAATWYMLPLILLGNVSIKRAKEQKEHKGSPLLRLWGLPSIIILVILSGAAIFGAGKLNTEFSQLMIFRKNTEVYQNFKSIMDVNKGSIPVYALITTGEDPLSPEYGNAVLNLEKKLTDSGLSEKIISVYDAYAQIYSQLKHLETVKYPENRVETDIISRVVSQNSDIADNLINRKERSVRMIIFPSDLKNNTIGSIADKIEEFDTAQEDIEIEVTGSQLLMMELNSEMTSGQMKSILLAFSIILLLLLISLRKIIPSVISIVPILFTTLFLFGFMGFLGISLNLFTATIFSITIGVGIDYAVHFTSVWQKFSGPDAAEKALVYTGRPITANAFGLAAGLSALLLSPLRIHLYISVLMWAAMMSGVFLSLSLLPTLLNFIYRRK